MKRLPQLSALICLVLMSAGCSALPSGDAPLGNIVSNPVVPEEKCAANRISAAEMLVPGATAALLAECPGEKIALIADDAMIVPLRQIFLECRKISANAETLPGQSQYSLQLSERSGSWQLVLRRQDQILWSESVRIGNTRGTL